MLSDAPTLVVAAAIFLLAGFVKGVIGMGLPLVVPSLVTNCWRRAAPRSLAINDLLTTMGAILGMAPIRA
jgi:hypothetical protein